MLMENKKELTHLLWDFEHLSMEERREFEGEILQARPEFNGRVVRVLPAFSEKWCKAFDEVVHGSQCQLPNCKAKNCATVKGIFRHGSMCKKGEDGGCFVCKSMWHHLRIHAQCCGEKSNCSVPHCRDLKLMFRRQTLDEVLHSSRCQTTTACEYPNCSKAKELFAHGMTCKTGGSGGCLTCQHMWRVLKLHTEACEEEFNCSVVGCRELKEYLRRIPQQED